MNPRDSRKRQHILKELTERRSPRSRALAKRSGMKEHMDKPFPGRLINKLITRLFDPLITRTVRETLAIAENDNTFSRGSQSDAVPEAER